MTAPDVRAEVERQLRSFGSLFSAPGATPLTGLGPVVNPTDSRWGASGTSDDSAAWQRAANSLANRGGLFYIPNNPVPNVPWRAADITFPGNGVSVTIMGETGSNCQVAPPTTNPTASVYDLTGRNGPTTRLTNHQLRGANVGLQESRLLKCNTTNGLRVDHMWFVGGLYGWDVQTPCTDCHVYASIFESCGQGVNIHSTPTAIVIRGCGFFDNVQDVQVTGDCSTFIFESCVSFRCTNVAFLGTACTGLEIGRYKIDTAALGVELSNCQDAVLRGIRTIRCTTDYANVGTFRVFADECNGDLSPFIGAGLYCGIQNATQRIVVTGAAPNSLSWTRGDIAYPNAPAVGSPRAWRRLTTGAANVLGVDWVSEGNL